MKFLSLFVPAMVMLVGCGANNTPPQTPIPGEKTSATLSTLETGAQVIQSRPPIDAISAYLDGFHFYSGDKNGQMEAHHYVTVLNDDVMQAVIYDGNTRDARLMGVEYIISERLFNTLPPEEKKLWHSHQYEVKSGSLVAPGLPAIADKALMKKIVNTYGKTWHTWHTDRDKNLPLGIPALMMGFTGEGQLDPGLLADRDRRLKINTQEIKRQRADIVAHPVAKGANAWQHGEVIQLQRVKGSGEHGKGDTAHFGTSEQHSP
ncbi:OBAP family protein [Leclercia pneumoniae]|uniref:OBAP family protein n=1 Tax=Leclercia pneumoniae TaxID=2815358 RepID=A0ABX8K098_9ENTR|nr:OBAP family protein [Leclercia pneumoniae]QSW33864.1 OBAP family protein [Leclercia pneumoniae]QWW81209.1 OBAP family protein [Leclercia pneumoniae]